MKIIKIKSAEILIKSVIIVLLMLNSCNVQSQNYKCKTQCFDVRIDSTSIDQWNYVISLCGDSIIELYRIDGVNNDVSPIQKLTFHNQDFYVILISELLVGYDYYIILMNNPVRFFISDHIEYFDLEDDRIWYIQNIREEYITVYFERYSRKVKIKLREILPQTISNTRLR